MRIGLQLPSFSYPGGDAAIRPRLAEIAGAAESAGFDSLWVMDHLHQLPADTGWGGPREPMLEAYAAIGYLAAVTERIALGALVGCAVFREPALLLKAATTVDVLSGGRTYVGLGAGWYAEEAKAIGMPFPPRGERFARLEETLRFLRHAWGSDAAPFDGERVRATAPIVSPRPIGRARPPIIVGGNGERRTLRLAARYADACNLLVLDPPQVRRKLAVLREHCERVGRPFDEIERTTLDEIDLRPGRMTTDDVVDRARAQAEAGIQHWIVNLPEVWDLRQLETLGREVVPAVAELTAGEVVAAA